MKLQLLKYSKYSPLKLKFSKKQKKNISTMQTLAVQNYTATTKQFYLLS